MRLIGSATLARRTCGTRAASLRLFPLIFLLTCAPALAARPQCEVARLLASDGEVPDLFGNALDLDGTQLLIGAWLDDDGMPADPNCNSGAAYVFELGLQGWSETQKLTNSPPRCDYKFGRTLAIDGDWIAVTCMRDGVDEERDAFVVLFHKIAGVWIEQQILRPTDFEPGDDFGSALALDGDLLAVGAPRDDFLDFLGPGSVYLYERGAQGWQLRQKILCWVPDMFMRFGGALDLDRDPDSGEVRLIVGAENDFQMGPTSGSAWIYRRQMDGEWVYEQRLVAADATEFMTFGFSVALKGAYALVGAQGDDEAGDNAGAAYLYKRGAQGWVQEDKWMPLIEGESARYGWSVDLGESHAVVGSPFFTATGLAGGSVFLHERGADGIWKERARLTPPSHRAGDFLGSQVVLDGELLLMAKSGAAQARGEASLFSIANFAVKHCGCEAPAPCVNPGGSAGCGNSVYAGGTIGARLSACGSSSVSADDLVLATSDLPPGSAALLFMGEGARATPLGDGLLCIRSAGLLRFPVRAAMSNGRVTYGPGLGAFASHLFGVGGTWLPASTWCFQLWYRDSAGPCGSGSNTSNAVCISFVN